ncbi:MAG: hypothetical protein EHM23_17675 [Acidobacteria bacterium]|nr:MAG: hypothetical protein EHM23_17675 [Acidobacteriota bacterium]
MKDKGKMKEKAPKNGDASTPLPLCPAAPLPLSAPSPLFPLGFTTVVALHVLYTLLNQTPPVWDMAYHQMQGFRYLTAWQSGAFWSGFADLSSYYPPLYYLQEAAALGLASYTEFLPLLVNLPGLFLLGFCTFRLARAHVGRSWAWLAGLLPLLFPLVAWTSRESLLDVSLSGWVAAAVFIIWRSRMLESHAWSLLLGVVFALGMLTKWTFPIFLVFPLGYAVYAVRDRKRSLLHLIDAVLIGMPLVFFWYLPNLKSLAERFALTSGTGTALEKDPTVLQLQAWLYYPRCMSSYYLYLPLTVLFVVGFAVWWHRARSQEGRTSLLWWWLGGSGVLLTLLDAKDPRYMMPLVAPVAILLVIFWKNRPRVLWAISVIAVLQFLLISFNFLGRPVKWAILDLKNDTDYISLSREWVFFQTHYFDAAGPAHREDWHLEDIIRVVPAGERVGFVPDMARFNPGTLQLTGLIGGKKLAFLRLGDSARSVEMLREFHYVVGKTGRQGLSYITAYNGAVYEKLKQENWTIIGQWEAPDGGHIAVWRRL